MQPALDYLQILMDQHSQTRPNLVAFLYFIQLNASNGQEKAQEVLDK